MVELIAAEPDDPARNADDRRPLRHLAQYYSVCRNAGVVANAERAKHLCAGADHDVVAERRMALADILARAAERYALIEQAVVPDLGGFADHDAGSVVNDQTTANGRAGMDLDTGHMPRKLRKRTREEKVLVLIEPVCLAVVKQSMEALIEEDDLERGARRRVAVADRASVVEQALEDHNTDIHSLEIKRTSRFAENTM